MWKEKYCRDTSLLANCYDHLFTWLIRYVSPLVQNKQTSTRSCSVRVILMISCLSVKKSAAYLLKTRDYWCLLVIWYQFIGIEDYMSSVIHRAIVRFGYFSADWSWCIQFPLENSLWSWQQILWSNGWSVELEVVRLLIIGVSHYHDSRIWESLEILFQKD